LFSDISSFAQNDYSSDSTLGEDSFRCNTATYGIEYEHDIGSYFVRKSVYILFLMKKNTRFKKRKQQRRDRKLFVFLAEFQKTHRKNHTDRLEDDERFKILFFEEF